MARETITYTLPETEARVRAGGAELLGTIEAGLKRLAEKHWAQVEATMTAQGFAPRLGGVLVLPEEQRETAPGFRPEWVAFSDTVKQPTLINPRRMGLVL